MRYSITTTTQPEGLPLTLPSMKNFLRITGNTEDELITDFIAQATDMAQLYLRRSLITRSLTLTLDGVPRNNSPWWDGVREMAISELTSYSNAIILPYPPAIAITSVTSYSTSDTSAVLASSNYFLDTAGGRLCLASGGQWPTDVRDQKAIEILYTAGYGTAPEHIPQGILAGLRMLTAHLYNNRDCAEIPDNAKSAFDAYRIMDSLGF